jgi:predicted phosphodiesterase
VKRLLVGALLAYLVAIAAPAPERFGFVLLGDRTGETVPGVYDRIWKEVAAEKPAFVAGVGDTIQGGSDATAEAEWKAIPRPPLPFYVAPGNHDVWSEASEKLFTKYTGHPLHYGFDFGPAHFTILDNSRSDAFSAAEMAFLEEDLKAHASQPIKFIVSHRPSWLIPVMLKNPDFDLQRLAKKYGVQYVIAGHVHKLAHGEVDGVTYISMPSAGGHLRDTGKYEDGWFFGYAVADVTPQGVTIRFKQLDGPTTNLSDWGIAGLLRPSIPPKP